MAQEDWEVVRFPAIAEEDEIWALDSELGQYVFTRQPGEASHPERQPPATLDKIRRVPGFIPGIGEYNFAGQVPTGPLPPGRWHGQGRVVSQLRGKRAARQIRPDRAELGHRQQGLRASPTLPSPACGGGKGGGPTSWGIKGKDLYLLHVLRRRMEYPELKRAVCEQCAAFAADVVLIEDKASGTQLIQELIENGFVHLPKEAAWLAEYLHELTVFPKGRHDDQVDSTAQMLDWFKRGGQEPQDWMWQQYKQALARGPQPTRPEPLSVMARRLGILREL